MAITELKKARKYLDLDLNFLVHPVRKDINKHVDEMAVINSIKNLVLTNFYERPFQPDLGSNVRRMLFENMDNITAAALEREIQETIENYEPRVRITKVTVTPNFDMNSFGVTMEFTVINISRTITINFLLERIR